jgi:hypothetical protein
MNNIGRVVKINDKEYHLPCSVCGDISFVFRIAIPYREKEEDLIYNGLTHSGVLGLDHRKRIFDLLEKGELFSLHSYFIKQIELREGMDAYCPTCDRIYCWKHYNVVQQFDEAFYDCSYGKCPGGHKRMIDD